MPSPYSLLTSACQHDAARPRLTWYDNTAGQRAELSGVTLLNWVNKTANFMIDELLVEPGVSIGLHLPRHWLTATWWLAAHVVGAEPVITSRHERSLQRFPIAVFGPEDLHVEYVAEHRVAVALTPLASGFTTPVHPDVHDFEREVRSQPDGLLGSDEGGGDPGQAALGQAAVDLATRWGLSPHDRLMSGGPVSSEDDLVGELLAPLAADASCVWIRNPDPVADVQHAVVERVTVTTMSAAELPQNAAALERPIRYLT